MAELSYRPGMMLLPGEGEGVAVAEVRVRDETMTGREIDAWVLPGLPTRSPRESC
jgi:hypothetical protein